MSIKVYTEEQRAARRARQAAYASTPEGKAKRAAYAKSPAAKATQAAYESSPSVKAKKIAKLGTVKSMFNVCKSRAKTRNIAFDITFEEFETLFINSGMKCALSGVDLTLDVGARDRASVDRKDSSLGYTLDNVQVLSTAVNIAKNDSSQFDFITMCQRVAKCHSTPSLPIQ